MKLQYLNTVFIICFFTLVGTYFALDVFQNKSSNGKPLNNINVKGRNMRNGICSECIFQSEVHTVFTSCLALEYTSIDSRASKIIKSFRFTFKPEIIWNVTKAAFRVPLQCFRMLRDLVIPSIIQSSKNLLKIFRLYLEARSRRRVFDFLDTFLAKFLVTYILHLLAAFFSFHIFNGFSQRVQAEILHVSGSQFFSSIIGFFQLNLINYYLNIFSEIIQIVILRLLFNHYEQSVAKSLVYNSCDFYKNTKNIKNVYLLIYHTVVTFVLSKASKMSLFSQHYLDYFFITNIFFKMFGGTYNKYSPSDVKQEGVYGKKELSLPVGMAYKTKKEGEILDAFFKRNGCHTCGSKKTERVIGDHQPPIKVVIDTVKYYSGKKLRFQIMRFFGRVITRQRMYPHCNRCSQLQSAAVRSNKLKLITHHKTIRLFHVACVIHLISKMWKCTKWTELFKWDGDNI